jgi:lysyl-tRNA synthetase class 1
MHWSEKIADSIIKAKPNKEEYVCAAGISPSGSVHIGNFRDVATSLFVVKSLQAKGKKAKLLFSWDEFDRLRKIPKNVDSELEKFIGCPYTDVKFSDTETYAGHFQKEFETALKEFGIKPDFRYQTSMYRSGKYKELLLKSLDKRREIFDILDSFRTQETTAEETALQKENYYPVSIYCPKCGKDTTNIKGMNEYKAVYTCKCGHEGEFDFNNDFNCKLAWKADWAMRWAYEGVDFEPGGKDHASPNGSYQTSKIIAKEIFGIEPPIFQGYEFIGIKGATGKMSGSSGLNLTPDTLLKIYQPEIILWLYARTEPLHAFDFCFDEGILRQYFEFDKMLDDVRNGKSDENAKTIISLCKVGEREIKTVPMNLLVQLGSAVDFNVAVLETVFRKIGSPYKEEEFSDRLSRAKYWLEQCSPESVNRLRNTRNWEVYGGLTSEEKEEVAELHRILSEQTFTPDELNTAVYAIPKKIFGGEDNKILKGLQGNFFKIVYKLLINKEKGPRLYLFLFAIEKERYLHLLDFSFAKTEAETQTEAEEEKAKQISNQTEVVSPQPPACFKEPDPAAEIKPEVSADVFRQIDLRVCEIVKCQEIRKSHNCYKLTLNDGLGERVIVSSIKNYYTPEELVGKKIIAAVNLTPVRITGVTSEGMLLAGTNSACGCRVVFAENCVPNGTVVG